MQQKVFISSRMKELSQERATVEEAVSELWTHENLPFTIWGWGDAKEIPSEKLLDKEQSEGAKDSDIYVLIYIKEVERRREYREDRMEHEVYCRGK